MNEHMQTLLDKALTLTEALPWIKRTWGRTVVVKYGGSAMTDPAMRASIAEDVVLMKLVGVNPVIVHGGGPDITAYMQRLGLPVEFRNGLRVTPPEAMEVVKMVLVGKNNKDIVSDINSHGRYAVGISGDDGNLIRARQLDPELGMVGEVTGIDTTVVDNLIGDGFIPVVATVGAGEDGSSYNINADTAAGEIAAALGAEKIIFLTDVDGLYADFTDKGSLISALSLEQARSMVTAGEVEKGMLPKVQACVRALEGGVSRAHILNGTTPHALLLEVYTDAGVGTMITRNGAPTEGEVS
ncbi:acetylglutamate kinase [Coriobacteriia bacterium Es71-Z0120]|uniref:acetylglutamate kinase n=1 Tax=Parvivirga hydrogeniphila TaxID=2939460 RepID=UPI00226082FD|nr:acetylglutamate kinase [Parvivirga hydrogeniphila]MCL4079249.1 acetylglutamate kinase [Parvivirga hydrogeniphila]